MKLCKYCKKPGKYYPIFRRILCDYHRDAWRVIAEVQFARSRFNPTPC